MENKEVKKTEEKQKKPISPETKKKYNEKYYAANKLKICEKLKAKVACPYCSKQVAHQNMPAHQKTAKCLLKQNSQRESDEEDTKNQIKQVKELMTKLYEELHKSKTKTKKA
jgi:hypothetical protein